ncbi:MAG: Regulator of chromosome condensation repeat [Bacteroidetes bacterium]|nr:Regulator of chromosome condensation repeat [Bacteroidota bacterium]
MKKITILFFCLSVFMILSAQNDWVKCGTGTEFSVALKSDGTLWSWGSNMNGQLGTGNTVNY